MTVWIATGSVENTKTSFEKHKWGVNSRLRGAWDRVAQGDMLFFYVTSPVCGIVGVTRVEGKAMEETMLWRGEAVVGRVLYPYRILFKPLSILNEEEWGNRGVKVSGLKISIRAGLNSVRDEDELNKLLDRIKKSWKIKVL